MATGNPYVETAGKAAILLFDNLEKQQAIPDQITQIETDIANNIDTTGDISVSDLLAANEVGVTLKKGLQDQQSNLNVEIDLAMNTIKEYFLADITAAGIVNPEGTKKVVYDSGTDTVSIVPYP